ncbi:MAG: universal stress protein [Bacteroidota bacterium]|nr:universal stress protein [Bacteroidota bacterium]
MKKILVPTDFSDLANHALDLAVAIASKEASEILLINVIEYPASPTFNVMGINAVNNVDNIYIVEIIERVKDQLEKTKKNVKFQNVHITTEVKVGNTFRSITEDVKKHGVELVVMGTKGTSGIEGSLIGSNTEKVVRTAKCPVLTIKNPVNLNTIKDIVFATNLSEEQEDLVVELKKLQALFGATIHVVKINTPNHFEHDREIKAQLQQFVNRYAFKDFTLNIYSHTHEEDGIIYFAADINADLIALGTHGRSGIMHLLSGSIAEDVVNHAKRPVWTYRLKK